jgi:tRNA pseudouridine38-40 synthase
MSPFWARYALHEARTLDLAQMQAAAELFLGKHDWTAFSAAQSDVEDRVRTITELKVSERFDERSHGKLIEIHTSADGFLRYMVRAIAGTLLCAGRSELDREVISEAIETGVRPVIAATAPACGLTLVSVKYTD